MGVRVNVSNVFGLPEPYYAAVREPRQAEPRTISVTELIQPPQMLALKYRHRHELVADASDMIHTFFGTAVHHWLDHHAGDDALSENKLTFEHDGWTVRGTPDHAEWLELADGATLTDWKTTRVRALGYDKPEWEQQVNLYAHLLRLNGVHVVQVQVWAFLKDWDKALLRDPEYPRAPLCRVPLPLWDAAFAHEFLLERLAMHREGLEDGAYGPCTPLERWQRPTYAVWSKRAATQRPSRVLADAMTARAWIESHTEHPRKPEDWWDVEVRAGEPLRCRAYCDVAAYCGQWQEEQRHAEETHSEGDAAPDDALPQVPRLRVVAVGKE